MLIYLHGITPSPTPESHQVDYDTFHNGIKSCLKDDSIRLDIEWGYDNESIQTNDKMLAPVEQMLLNEVQKVVDNTMDYSLNPLRFLHNEIRRTFLLGFADIFYYVSEDGKSEIRRNVFNRFIKEVYKYINEDIDFTIICHSAGTIIMHDLLYVLFGTGNNHFLDKKSAPLLDTIKNKFKSNHFRLRNFITLGSPITPLAVRSQNLLGRFYNDGKTLGKIKEVDLGIRVNIKSHKTYWLNFWDKDDIISFPVAFLYENKDKLIRDYHPDVGDLFPAVHNKYWSSERVHIILRTHFNENGI